MTNELEELKAENERLNRILDLISHVVPVKGVMKICTLLTKHRELQENQRQQKFLAIGMLEYASPKQVEAKCYYQLEERIKNFLANTDAFETDKSELELSTPGGMFMGRIGYFMAKMEPEQIRTLWGVDQGDFENWMLEHWGR